MSQDRLLESVESGFEGSLIMCREDRDVSPTADTVLEPLQHTLSRLEREVATMAKSNVKLRRKVKELEKANTTLREQEKSLNNENNFLKDQREAHIQQTKTLAKGKESELLLEKRKNLLLEVEVSSLQRDIDKLQKKCNKLEQDNDELTAKNKELEDTIAHSKGRCDVGNVLDSHTAALQSIIRLSEESLAIQRDLGNRQQTSVRDSDAQLMVSSSLPCSSSLVDREWGENVRRHFYDMVRVLKLGGLLDRLYAKDLLTTEEYQLQLTSTQSEKDRIRLLLISILPSKGKGAFQKFCHALRQDESPGTRAIADLIDKS